MQDSMAISKALQLPLTNAIITHTLAKIIGKTHPRAAFYFWIDSIQYGLTEIAKGPESDGQDHEKVFQLHD